MAIGDILTMEDAKKTMQTPIDQKMVDEFQRASFLVNAVPWQVVATPGVRGSTLGYEYTYLKEASTVKMRKVNTEYAPTHAVRGLRKANICIFGGSFSMDRITNGTSGSLHESAMQMTEKIKASSNYLHNLVINGCVSTTASNSLDVVDTFDGLRTILSGTTTELYGVVDISTGEKEEANKYALLSAINGFLKKLEGKPTMLLMNGDMQTKIATIAMRCGYFSQTENAFGEIVDNYRGIPMMNLGYYYDEETKTTQDIVPTEEDGTSCIYAVQVGLDGFHGITADNGFFMKRYEPDFNAPGAVKFGEVEMLAGVVLKHSKKAGVLRGIKIAESVGN